MSFTASKQLRVTAVKGAGDGSPSSEQMTAINRYTLKELKPEDVYVRSVYLAHNAIDRDGEVFDDELLEDFAASLPGKGFFVKHPMGFDGESGPGEGLWFEAKVLSMTIDEAKTLLGEDLVFPPETTAAKVLEASRYMLRLDYDTETRKLIDKQDAGIAGHHSIGFGAKGRTDIVDDYGNGVAQRLMSPGEAYEASVVWLGAQPGARAYKGAGQQHLFEKEFTEEEPAMAMSTEEKEQFDKAVADTKTAKAKLNELEPKAATHDEIMKAAGEGADEKSVIALITAGQSHRKSLEEDMLRFERLQGLVGDSEDDAKSANAVYAQMDIKTLESRVKALQEKFPGDQIDGADTATGADDGEGKKGLRDASVTSKAMGKDKAA
ncbi:MAG: hypothetical protein HUJ30_02380 [Gammaproteobacteria bacterium]|nr:hypothetical protein [Gammaproteobacteria bacterium]